MHYRISVIIIPSVIAIGIIFYMIYIVRDSLSTALEMMIPSYLVIAITVCCIAWFLRGWRYQYILDGIMVRASVTYAIACIFISQTANLLIPARLGDLVRMLILKHDWKTPYSQGLSSIVIERIFDILMVAFLGLISLNSVFNVPWEFYILILVCLIGGVIFLVFLYVMEMKESRNPYIAMVITILREIRQASLNIQSLFILSVSSIVIWLFDVLVCIVVLAMFQQNLSPIAVMLAIAIGNLVKAVPITPGGIGTYEAALALIFSLAGLPMVIATLVALIDHLIKNVVTLVGGVISVYYFGDWVISMIKKAFKMKIGVEDSGRD